MIFKKLVFTGGGTAGHVTPNLALMDAVRERGWEVCYLGSATGIEREMVVKAGVSFHPVASGKLRRYFSWRNFIDPFHIIVGVFQAYILLGRLRPDLVFSKGGFVAVPVVVSAWLRKIPVISHESDVTPGLANRLCYRFCRRICVTFKPTLKLLPAAKVVFTGTPVRSGILNGNALRGRRFLDFDDSKPTLLVFGGSLGSAAINRSVRHVLPELLARFQVIHIVGRDNIDLSFDYEGYRQKEFIGKEFGDVLAAASVVVSRAGANSLYELLVTRKPHLLIPLTLAASRGDQLANAKSAKAAGFSEVLSEDSLDDRSLLEAVVELQEQSSAVVERLSKFPIHDSVDLIICEIERITT